MPSSNVCWGIEVGAGAIKAVKLEREGQSLKVVDFAVIPHKKVLSTPDLDQTDAIRVGLGALVSQHDLKKATIAISIPGHSAFARFAKLPPVEPSKIADIVKYEAVQQIPFPIDDVEWDYQVFANPDSPDVEAGIFAVTRERVMDKLGQWSDFSVTPDIVNLSPISVFNAIAYDMAFSNKTPGTVILDVGTTSTDLVVAEAGRVWVRTFPVGGHQFTEALVEAFKLTYSKAEKLKREAETSKHARHVFQAMRPIFSDLAQEVQRSIGYYQSLHREANLTRLIVLGSTFNLPGLKKYLGQQLQMEVVQMGQFNRMTVDGPRAGEFQAATLNLATAYGLAIQGLGLAAIDANLMPVKVLREVMWKGKVKWFAAAAALSLVAGGLSFTGYFLDKTRLEGNPPSGEIREAKNLLSTLKAEWQTIETGYQPDYSAANASILLENRHVIPWIMDDVSKVLETAKQEAERHPPKEAGPPGLLVQKVTTQYASSGASAEDGYDMDSYGGAPMDVYTPRASKTDWRGQRIGGNQTPMPTAETPPPTPEPSTPETASTAGAGSDSDGQKFGPSEGPPRVLVTLTVKTVRDDPFDFLTNTVQKWLNENKERGAAPYSIKHIEWRQVGQPEEIPKDANDPMATGSPTTTRDSGPVRPGVQPSGPGSVRDRYQRPADPYPRGEASGGGASDPNQLAPLPTPAPIAPPGSKVRTFEITWEAYLKSAKPVETAPEGGA